MENSNTKDMLLSSQYLSSMNKPYNYISERSPILSEGQRYRMLYPEIFYKIQPFILSMCDQITAYDSMMPSPELIDQMTDDIYENVRNMYPEINEYAKNIDNEPNNRQMLSEVISYGNMYRRGNRRRGLLGDLINILLLSELFNRRRRFY